MMIQGTEAWHRARLGKVTASRVAEVVTRTKTGYSASRANYAAELLCERLTQTPTETFCSPAMQWGRDNEPLARAVYEQTLGVSVFETGFVDHPEIPMSGASPDGLVGNDGLVEIKAPNTATHLDTLEAQTVPGKYLIQIQWQLACTGRDWCDFVSFDPRLPPEYSLFVKRIPRDASHILELEGEVSDFLCDLDKRIAALGERFKRDVAA